MQFPRFHLPAVMRLAGQKSGIHAQEKKAFLKSSRECLKVLQLRALPPCSSEYHLKSGEASTRACTPRGIRRAYVASCLSWPLSDIAIHQLYSVMKWNWGGGRRDLTWNIFPTGICCIRCALRLKTVPRTQKPYMEFCFLSISTSMPEQNCQLAVLVS